MVEDDRVSISRLLSIQEVASMLHVHPSTLRRWSNRGLIKAQRITPRGDRRYRRQDIARFLAEMNAPELDVKETKSPWR